MILPLTNKAMCVYLISYCPKASTDAQLCVRTITHGNGVRCRLYWVEYCLLERHKVLTPTSLMCVALFVHKSS